MKKYSKRKLDLDTLENKTLLDIDFALLENSLSEEKIYNINQDFFRTYLELNYPPSYEEIIDELQKIYIDKKQMLEAKKQIEKVGLIEYSKNKLGQKELEGLLYGLEDMVKFLIQHKRKKENVFIRIENELKKLFFMGHVEFRPLFLAKTIKEIKTEKNNYRAKKKYKQLLKLYDQLPKHYQEKYYKPIHSTYEELIKYD